MVNGSMTTKERLARLEALMETVKDDVEEIKDCIIPLKIKVYTGACVVSILVTTAGLILTKIL